MLENSPRPLLKYFSTFIHLKFVVGNQRTVKIAIFGLSTYPRLPLIIESDHINNETLSVFSGMQLTANFNLNIQKRRKNKTLMGCNKV